MVVKSEIEVTLDLINFCNLVIKALLQLKGLLLDILECLLSHVDLCFQTLILLLEAQQVAFNAHHFLVGSVNAVLQICLVQHHTLLYISYFILYIYENLWFLVAQTHTVFDLCQPLGNSVLFEHYIHHFLPISVSVLYQRFDEFTDCFSGLGLECKNFQFLWWH